MTTVIIDERNKEGKAILEFLSKTKYAEILNEEPNSVTLKAVSDANNGKTIKAKNVDEMFNEIGS